MSPQPVPKPALTPRLPPQPGTGPCGPQTWSETGQTAANPRLFPSVPGWAERPWQ